MKIVDLYVFVNGIVASLVWSDRYVSPSTKIRLLRALIRSIATYGSETWTIECSNEKKKKNRSLRSMPIATGTLPRAQNKQMGRTTIRKGETATKTNEGKKATFFFDT